MFEDSYDIETLSVRAKKLTKSEPQTVELNSTFEQRQKRHYALITEPLANNKNAPHTHTQQQKKEQH